MKALIEKERLLRSTMLAGFAVVGLGIAPAYAQDVQQVPQQEEQAETEDRIVITGSRIARSATNAPTPLIQLSADDIVMSGEPNVVDFLADVPALQGSVVPEDTTGSNLNDGGLSLLNLRQLGSNRTLTLVDGRRHVGSSPGSLAVDVDTIPSLLIESVEVITGGQSAVYGADAVSGVVNFILRDDFEGIEVDATLSQINQDGQTNTRLSAIWGENLMDDRLNVYVFGEYQDTEEVLDFDIDWRRASPGLIGNDSDTAANPSDGDFDSILTYGRRDAFFARGGLLVLAGGAPGSATNDPDSPFSNCTVPFGFIPSACRPVRADTGNVYAFNADGTPRPYDFGTLQDGNGLSRRISVGGDGLNSGTEFGQGSRIPRSEATRFQAGLNFELNSYINVFAEAKHVEEETFDTGQPTFWQLTLWDVGSFYTGNSFYLDYTDNAYALQSGLADLINNHERTIYGAPTATSPSQPIGTVADRRAYLGMFGPSRSQLNNRDLNRFVIGADGVAPDFGFLHDISWEVSYTYGEMSNSNLETGVDITRFQYAADAVLDGSGNVVCRITRDTAPGDLPDDAFARAAIEDCTPINIFGTDFRADANHPEATGGGGRTGLTAEQEEYLLASIEVTDENHQRNFLAFGSAETWDFWGAGAIGVALGYEYRREETQGTGRDRDTAGRNLFLNTGPDFPQASYETNEVFTEVRVPLLDNQLWMDSAEISGAYRWSDYTTVGEVDTLSLQASLRPTEDIFFRATYGEATRIPNLGENFRPAVQTFGNGLNDPCDAAFIRGLSDAADRAALRANCVATLPTGYDPGTDTVGTGTEIDYTSGIPGFNQGNPNLEPEESTSYTFGVAVTPRWLPAFTFTADYFDIEIDNVIASVSIQQALNQCVGLASGNVGSVNPGACSTFERTAVPVISQQPAYGIHTFIQGSLNYAGLETRGIDFTSTYGFETDRLGDFDWTLRGTYLIENNSFTNIAVPGEETANDSSTGEAHVRFLSTVSWQPREDLILAWDWDWQSSQEIIDEDDWRQNPDGREFKYTTTGDFSQHDFTVRYLPTDDLTLRAGVVNAFDAEPAPWLGTTTADNFDFWGRRFFVGVNIRH
ncbi:TonB-dependent receptor domain-containing protein [Maricaulis sp. D1M11]|uniref:TonB-dependent receptor domain-containing protein n=1 Tax=Maricaulis sp. D1M11 TaxID=3076117 RepID=UPI0039B3E88F